MIELKKASETDLFSIAEMAEEIWLSYYTEFIPELQVRYMLNKFYSHESLQNQIQNNQDFYLIHENGKSIGFVSVSRKGEESFFIHKIYIYSKNRSKNAGTEVLKLLVNLFKQVCNSGNIQIRLTVNRQNFKAINFYFKNGFKIESVEDFDIGNGFFMNDFVLIKEA